MAHGRVGAHVVMPSSITLSEAQRRVERWAGWRFLPTIVALGPQDWILHMPRLPQNVITAYLALRVVQGLPISEDTYETEEIHEQDIEDMRRFLRGGAQEPLDHRAMMLAWARDRISREAEEFAGPTSDMILKAEGRTVSAVLNSRSPAQVRDVISSAWRRANTQAPQVGRPIGSLAKANVRAQAAQQPATPATAPFLTSQHQRTYEQSSPIQGQPETMSLDDIAVMIASHSRVLAQIVDMIAMAATKNEMSHLTATMAQVGHSVDHLHAAISSVENRVNVWETSILPHIVDRHLSQQQRLLQLLLTQRTRRRLRSMESVALMLWEKSKR